ncbi:MAG: hypothetical protein WC263_03015 [Candidatus Micrarchaeia archaeon]|jgi:hypothetical protein
MQKTQPRFPAHVRAFVKDMLSVNPSASIYQILPLYDKYYHQQRRVVDRATAFSKKLPDCEDGAKLCMAIRIYNEAVVGRVFMASPPAQPVINEFMRCAPTPTFP